MAKQETVFFEKDLVLTQKLGQQSRFEIKGRDPKDPVIIEQFLNLTNTAAPVLELGASLKLRIVKVVEVPDPLANTIGDDSDPEKAKSHHKRLLHVGQY
jgi:hypothetical protein